VRPAGRSPVETVHLALPTPPHHDRAIRNGTRASAGGEDSGDETIPELIADLEGELLLRPLAGAVGRVVLGLAHLDVELEGPDLGRDAAQRAVLRKRQSWWEHARVEVEGLLSGPAAASFLLDESEPVRGSDLRPTGRCLVFSPATFPHG
jgi:hypothetical protein